MTGLLARLAARGAGRALAGAPAALAAPVRPRFAPPETGAHEIGEAWETDAEHREAAPTTPGNMENEPGVRAAPGRSDGEHRSEPLRREQARSDGSRAQADVPRSARPSDGPATDRSRPASPGTAAPVPEGSESVRSAIPRPPAAPPDSTGEPPTHPTKAASRHEPDPAPRQLAEPQAGHPGAPETASRNALPNDDAPQAAGAFVPQHQSMHTLQPFAPGAAEAPADPPPRLSIGRIDVIFEAPQPPPAPRRRALPERTRGFAGFDRARLGLRR